MAHTITHPPVRGKPAILFVCLGNICRSPLAEGAFRAEAARRGLDVAVDSAGTGAWHQGEAPDPRAQAVAISNGVDISRLRARQVVAQDFDRFDLILGMDDENMARLRQLAPTGARARLSLLLDHVPGHKGQSVADPWYGGLRDFELTWHEVSQAARALADVLTVERGGGPLQRL
ncbi:low molecular weight protein-tyrosine-phosphatase [Paracoccus sp. (in: a-proteobacteria)]|uniref:low molecular weight protein-tyrosine-phosphatase n=1 Tax=Paracoccus sp. TaxID=267 RepID=UPI003A8826E0